MSKYRTILFDADDTLLDFHRAEHDALVEALSAFGIASDDGVVAVYSDINAMLWRALERGEIDKNRLRVRRFELFCEKMGYDVDVPALAVEYTDRLAGKSYVIPGADEICRKLSEKYSLYVITNGIKTIQTRRFAASGLKQYFIRSFISEEVGFEKPDPRFFAAVADGIVGFDRDAALVVGDSLTSDIRGGYMSGIDTCWLNAGGRAAPDDLKITYTINNLSQLENILL